MKANEFVKKFGWEEARKACSGVFSGEVVYKRENINIDDLKRLVESWELVESFGGLELAKKELQRQSILRWINPKTEALREAIADVESCQFKSAFEDDRTDFVSDIANHISPTTVVIER